MKTKTDDYLEKILERFEKKFYRGVRARAKAGGFPEYLVKRVLDGIDAEKAFISKEFREYEKRVRRELADK